MSAIEALLGPCPGNPDASTGNTQRTLLMEDDVFIHLQEDESREEVTFYSVPGSMQEVEWLSARTEAWSDVLPHPAHEQARCALTVDPTTRQVFLSETWPRAAVDLVVLGQLLERAHRTAPPVAGHAAAAGGCGGAAEPDNRRDDRLNFNSTYGSWTRGYPTHTLTGQASLNPKGTVHPADIPGTSSVRQLVGYSAPTLPQEAYLRPMIPPDSDPYDPSEEFEYFGPGDPVGAGSLYSAQLDTSPRMTPNSDGDFEEPVAPVRQYLGMQTKQRQEFYQLPMQQLALLPPYYVPQEPASAAVQPGKTLPHQPSQMPADQQFPSIRNLQPNEPRRVGGKTAVNPGGTPNPHEKKKQRVEQTLVFTRANDSALQPRTQKLAVNRVPIESRQSIPALFELTPEKLAQLHRRSVPEKMQLSFVLDLDSKRSVARFGSLPARSDLDPQALVAALRKMDLYNRSPLLLKLQEQNSFADMVGVVNKLPPAYTQRETRANAMLKAMQTWEGASPIPSAECSLMALLYLFAGCASRMEGLRAVLKRHLPKNWPPSLEDTLRTDLIAIWSGVSDEPQNRAKAELKALILERYGTTGSKPMSAEEMAWTQLDLQKGQLHGRPT